MNTYRVTYELVTETSAFDGEAEEQGFLDANGTRFPTSFDLAELKGNPPPEMSLREAVKLLFELELEGPIEADVYPLGDGSQVSSFRAVGCMNYEGVSESRSLHLPKNLQGKNALRIAKFLL